MFNLIKAELYKYRKKKFIYKTNIILLLLIVLYFSLIGGNGILDSVHINIFNMLSVVFAVIPPLVYIFLDVFTEEFKEETFKNIISSNISREKIYLSKFIVQIILAIITSIICMTVVYICIMLFGLQGKNFLATSNNFLLRFLSGVPIYIAVIALGDLLIVLIKKEIIASMVFYVIIFFSKQVFGLLGHFVSPIFDKLVKYTITAPLEPLQYANATLTNMYFAITVGIVYTVVLLSIGIFVFKNQEIK
ncbi:ABC transporter permease [Eubacterium multiforme]|uniref:ABC-2 type transport system permease protein n=1 Tax=Eubacterium multiforme TaxID=83339 RepID=A0ABT9UXZ4_9FIRM|nr:ABC transporter permease [Eubacterium multiforme]MDQ0151197.1 ABC-2 type transport system permease protein [Eubacterium multiforme]